MILEYENQQQTNKNEYRIEIGISKQNFQQKPLGTEIRKIQFKKESITIQEMAEMIKQGYCFSHNFNTQQQVYGLREKTIYNFSMTNYLWIDIDKSDLYLKSFYDQLNHKPTIAYTTLSNTDQSCRLQICS